MRTELKNEFSRNRTLFLLSLWCVLAGASSFVLGELAVIPASALLASIFVFESGHTRTCSIIVSAALVAINIVMVAVLQTVVSVWSLTTVLCALVIAICYKKGTSVFDASLIVTAVIAFFFVASLTVVGMMAAKEFTFEAAKDYYFKLYHLFQEKFSELIVNLYAQVDEAITRGASLTVEEISAVIDLALSLMIAVLVVVSFAMAGVSFKLFRNAMARYALHSEYARGWRFVPPAFFGHFYIILVLAYFILSNSTGITAIVVANVYLIFMYMYAYVGAKILYQFLAQKKSKVFAALMIALGLLTLSSLATQVLALLGAFNTTRRIPEEPSDK